MAAILAESLTRSMYSVVASAAAAAEAAAEGPAATIGEAAEEGR